MASQVLSGSSNVTYTNTTGENVRIIINYMKSSLGSLSMTWSGVTISGTYVDAIGKNLGAVVYTTTSNFQNATPYDTTARTSVSSFPTEIMLSNNQSFSAVCGAYNIIVIPEAG